MDGKECIPNLSNFYGQVILKNKISKMLYFRYPQNLHISKICMYIVIVHKKVQSLISNIACIIRSGDFTVL